MLCYYPCVHCINFGKISGTGRVGGIVGSISLAHVKSCINHGVIIGNNTVGGIAGFGNCADCYSTASITGESTVGGIAGSLNIGTVTNCYNIGNINCTSDDGLRGAIVGSDGAVWDKFTLKGCYYLKTASVNASLYGCGGVTSSELEPGGTCAKSAAELKKQETYEDWDFYETWRIDSQYNDGYPYLAWERVSVNGEADGDDLTYTVRYCPANALLIAARYDTTGRMTYAHTVALPTGDSHDTIAMGGSGTTYKLMLVDKTSFAPLCAAWDSSKG